MFCQIVAVAPSSGDFLLTKSGILKKKSLNKIIITLLPRSRPDRRKCVTSMIFQELLVFFLDGLGGGVPNWKTQSDSFVKKNYKPSWQLVMNRKVPSSQTVLLWIFLHIRNFIWRYNEFNRLLVGSGLIPLIIDLQQDDRTVCCGNNTVPSSHHNTDTVFSARPSLGYGTLIQCTLNCSVHYALQCQWTKHCLL